MGTIKLSSPNYVNFKLSDRFKVLLVSLLLIMCNANLNAQSCPTPSGSQTQMRKWILPPNIVDFTSGTPTLSQIPNILSPLTYTPDPDGTAKHSANAAFDDYGNLLFYVMDGRIFNQLGNLMNVNQPTINNSNHSETIILPRPGYPMQYFVIFPEQVENFDSPTGSGDIEWNIVDMCEPTAGTSGFGDVLYSLSQKVTVFYSPRANQLHIAATPLRSDNTYLLFVQQASYIYKIEVSASGLSLLSGSHTFFGNGFGAHTSEMEVIELPGTTPPLASGTNPAYRLAFTHHYGSGVNYYYYVADLDNNGNVIADEQINNYAGTVRPPKGIEFSPNGKYLYYSQFDTQNPLGYIDLTSLPLTFQNFSVTNAADYKLGNIEMAYNGKMHFAAANKLGVLANPNNPSTFNWSEINNIPIDLVHNLNLSFCPNSPMQYDCAEFMMYALPDQIDGYVYENEYANETCCENLNNYTISSYTSTQNATWTPSSNPFNTNGNSCVYIDNELRIVAGHDVYIMGLTIYFGAGADVIVEPGATLLLDNGMFTSNNICSETTMWDGVQVWGNTNQPQTYAQQGFFILNSSTIENAHHAVRTYKPGDPTKNGGIFHAMYSTFRNNQESVHFNSYPTDDSDSKISDCEFIIDGDLNNPNLTIDHFIEMNEIGKISINSNTFNQNLQSDGITAIKSTESSFEAGANDFSNIIQGIFASNAMAASVKISTNTFDNVGTNVRLSGIDHAIIINNTFKSGKTGSVGGTGLSLVDCDQYTVEDNVFYSMSNNLTYGLHIQNSGDNFNEVYRNDFHDLEYGTYTIMDNDGPLASDGLHLKCNRYYNIASTNWALLDAIGAFQGYCDVNDPKTTANNVFTNDCSNNKLDIYLDPPSSLEYRYHSPTSNTEPICNQGNVFKVACNRGTAFNYGTACPSNYSGGGSEPGDPGLFISLMKSENEEAQKLSELIDGGNTQNLKDVVSNVYIPQSEVEKQLIAASPYLSNEVLSKFIEVRANNVEEDKLMEVLIKNSPLQTEILNQIQNHLLLSNANMNRLMNAQFGISNMMNLKSQIAGHLSQRALHRKQLASFYLYDTSGVYGVNDVIELYRKEEKPSFNLKIISLLISDGDYEKAEKELLNLKNMNPEKEILEYINYQELIIKLKKQDAGFFAIQNDIVLHDKVKKYAYSETPSKVRTNARAILTLVFNEEFSLEEKAIEDNKMERKLFNDHNNATDALIRIYPNPSNGQFNLEYQLPKNQNNAQLKIFNMNGALIFDKFLQFQEDIQVEFIELSEFSNGMYFYLVENKGSILNKGKIVINK